MAVVRRKPKHRWRFTVKALLEDGSLWEETTETYGHTVSDAIDEAEDLIGNEPPKPETVCSLTLTCERAS